MSVFVDTSALLAVLDADDAEHETAKATWQRLITSEEPLVASNYVLVETFALAQRRLGMEAARAFHEDICPVLDIEWVSQDLHQAGAAAALAAGRRQLSLVDCVSFELMRRTGVARVFCFDRHFQEEGFEDVAGATGI
jgi:predicted nucleic acid-binding protein